METTEARRPIRSYEDIEAWQRAMKLVAPVHALVKGFPSYERHDLASQMRRAAKSVPANIAEGFAKRSSAKAFKDYLRMALAPANEMEVHLTLAAALGYLADERAEQYRAEYGIVGRQPNRLISNWRTFRPPASSFQL